MGKHENFAGGNPLISGLGSADINPESSADNKEAQKASFEEVLLNYPDDKDVIKGDLDTLSGVDRENATPSPELTELRRGFQDKYPQLSESDVDAYVAEFLEEKLDGFQAYDQVSPADEPSSSSNEPFRLDEAA